MPTGQMVDSYEMIDGSKFSWDNPEHKAEPYKNRDPRFYAVCFMMERNGGNVLMT